MSIKIPIMPICGAVSKCVFVVENYKAQKYFKEVVSTTLLFDLFGIIDFGIKVFATTTFLVYNDNIHKKNISTK